MSPPNERGADPVAHRVSPTTAQDRTASQQTKSHLHGSDAADKNAAQTTLADAVRDLAHHHGDGRLLDALIVYIASALPDERHERLAFAASEAARIVALGGTTRTTAFIRLALAAQMAGIGRSDAEAILRDALAGGPR